MLVFTSSLILLFSGLVACADEVVEAEPIEQVPVGATGMAIALTAPMTGANAALGKAALEGVKHAVPPGIGVLVFDEALGDPVPRVIADPRVVGVVAHVTEVGAEKYAAGWAETDLATILAAPATIPGVPRVLGGADRHVRCATAFMGRGRALIVHDGTAESTQVANAAERELYRRSMGIRAIDPRLMANEADKVRSADADWIVYTGTPGDGGNLLRAMRQLGGRASFLGIGLYDPRFVAAAGAPGLGAIVTSQNRPALDDALLAEWRESHEGTDPPAVALNAYDAARLLVEAWATASVPSRVELRGAVKARLTEIEINGVAGPMRLDADGIVTPAWCMAFEVGEEGLAFHGVARVVDGKVQRVDIEEERAARRELEAKAAAAATAEAAETEAQRVEAVAPAIKTGDGAKTGQ